MAPKREFEHDVKLDVETRVRQGVKAVLEEVLEEEMTQHLGAGYQPSISKVPPERWQYTQLLQRYRIEAHATCILRANYR